MSNDDHPSLLKMKKEIQELKRVQEQLLERLRENDESRFVMSVVNNFAKLHELFPELGLIIPVDA